MVGQESYDRYMRDNPRWFQESLRIERERFGNVLTDLLDATDYQPPDRTLTIADVACGCCVEAPVLVDVFGRRDGNRQVNIVGIDSVQRRIEIAREQAAGLPGNHTFTVADATANSAYGNHEFDVALFRRQNIFNQPPLWAKIFETAIERMGSNSLAIVTSLSGHEHIMALEAFRQAKEVPVLAVPLATRYAEISDSQSMLFEIMPIESCASVYYPVHKTYDDEYEIG